MSAETEVATLGAPTAATATATASGVRAHLSEPLFANAYALIGSTGITTILGFAYWIVASRLFPVDEVGRSQTAVNTLIILSGLGSFRLISALTRFLPCAGDRTNSLLVGSYAAAAAGSVLVGLGYVLLFRGPTGVESFLGPGPLAAAAVVGAVVVWSIFTLQDAALTGLRHATWVPIANGLHSAAKLAMLPVLAGLGVVSYGVFASWMIPTLIALVPVNVLIVRRVLPRHIANATATSTTEHLTLTKVRDFVGADYVGSLSELAVVNLVPLVIAAHLGLEAVGYFGPVWMIGTMLDHVLVHFGSSLTVEGAREPHRLAELSRHLLRRSLFLVVPMVAGLVVATPVLLRAFGPGYAERVGTTLQLCSVALLPRLLVHVVLTAARVRGQVGQVLGIQVVLALLTFAVAAPLLDRFGLSAPGIGYLVASIVVAVGLLPKLVDLMRDGRL